MFPNFPGNGNPTQPIIPASVIANLCDVYRKRAKGSISIKNYRKVF